MTLKLVKKGVADQYNDHSRLNNLDLEDQHPIKAIIGLQDELDRLNKSDESIREDVDNAFLELIEKIESGEIGGIDNLGQISISYKSDLEYEGTKLVKETFTGDINKTVTYEYDDGGNIINKTVENPERVIEATYEYDNKGNLIKINDNGTDTVQILGIGGFSKHISKNGTVNNADFLEIINIGKIVQEEKLASILNIELLVKNPSSSNSYIEIVQSGVSFGSILVDPNDIHKYDLGASKSITVLAKGNIYFDISINGVRENGEYVEGDGGGSSLPSDTDNTILARKVKALEQNLKDLLMASVKMQYKYDRALGIDENYLHGYYIDSKAKTLTKESE